MNLRQLSKTIALALCNAVAALLGKRKQPSILMYHSFDTTDWKHGVNPRELEKQITYLKKHRTIVPLSQIVEWVRGEGELAENAAAITIDDGYEDTYSVFFPLAQKYQLPFTLFLTTNLSTMPKLGNLPRPTIAQLKEMNASGLMTLGLHGHSHVNFPDALRDGQLENELKLSHDFVTALTGYTPQYVAYPAGRYDVNVVRKVKELKYTAACSTIPGVIGSGDDLMLLKRIGVDKNTSFQFFKQKLGKGFPLFIGVLGLSRRVGRLLGKVFRVVKKILRGSNPLAVTLPQANWDSQYERGYWNFLLDTPANVQYIVSHLHTNYSDKKPKILDVGCGNGAIPKLLKEQGLAFDYVGTDISEVAVTQAREHYPEGRFFVATMESPIDMEETFDVIIFCEVLLYGNAAQTIQLHRKFIRNDTLVIVSLYQSWRTWLIWLQINRLFSFQTVQVLTDKEWGSGWKVKVGLLRNR